MEGKQLESSKFAAVACRVFAQLKRRTDDDGNPIAVKRGEFFAELAAILSPYGKTVQQLEQKFANEKSQGRYSLPPVPAGQKGRKVDAAKAAADRQAAILDMAYCGMVESFDENGDCAGFVEDSEKAAAIVAAHEAAIAEAADA